MSTNTTTAPRPTIRITDLVGVTAARRQIQQVAQQPLTSSRSRAPIRRATPQAVSQTADTTPAQSPNFNLITSTGVVPATVTYPPHDFTPATPQAIRQIEVSRQRQQFAQRVEPMRVGATTQFGRFAEQRAFALSARQETLLRQQQREFSPVRQLDLVGTGVFQRGVQTAGAVVDVTTAPIPTAQRAVQATRRGVDAFRFTFQRRAQEQGTLSAFRGVGTDVITAGFSPLIQAQQRPGTFAFDVGVTAGALTAAGVASRAISGRPTGRPVGDIQVRLREQRTVISDVPQTPPPRQPPRITQPDIQLQFAESRGFFRTPAQTTINIRGDVIGRVQQLPDQTIVTAQRVGDPIAREITFRGAPGIRGRARTVREVDPIQIQQPTITTPQITLQPDPVEILTRGAGFRQERQLFTLMQPSPTRPLTLRGQFVVGQRVIAAPATLQEFQTVVFRRAGRQAIVTDPLSTRFMTRDVQFTRGIFENPALWETATQAPVASLLPTRGGVLSQVELRGTVLRSPPALQITTERLRAVGVIRQVPVTERISRAVPSVALRPLGRRAQLQLLPETRLRVPIQEFPTLRVSIPFPRVRTLRTPMRRLAPITQQTFTGDLQARIITPAQRIAQPAALFTAQAQVQTQLNIFRTARFAQTPVFTQLPGTVGFPGAGFRIPLLPSLPVVFPTPPLLPGAPRRGREPRSLGMPTTRRTRTILQQFLGGARGTREREVTGLFLRN